MRDRRRNIVDGIDLRLVQGNILKAFGKPHVRLLFFKFGKNDLSNIQWLIKLAQAVPNTRDLLDASESPNNYQGVLVHIGLSFSGIRSLGLTPPFARGIYKGLGSRTKVNDPTRDVMPVSDRQYYDPFYGGMKSRAEALYDRGSSSPDNWEEPYRSENFDVIIIMAAKQEDDLDSFVSNTIAKATSKGITCTGMEIGRAVFNEQGKQVEHFGFRDGVSQPLVKGIDDEHIRDRANYKDSLSPKDFVLFGLTGDLEWANHGSFLAFKKLEQDVPAFWEFMVNNCREAGMGPEEMAARLVGRWKSGSPLAYSPDFDPVAPKSSDKNDFQYLSNRAASLRERPDPDSIITPTFAHIRLANLRDVPDPQEAGKSSKQNLNINNQHRILRRGIPYGPQWAVGQEGEHQRGLLFICYQRDIQQQFEYIQRNLYMENPYNHPETNKAESKDLYIKVTRMQELLRPGGAYSRKLEHWVTTKGGGYFFSPSINVLRNLHDFTSKGEGPTISTEGFSVGSRK
jgi:Dyp-type peroxidase family